MDEGALYELAESIKSAGHHAADPGAAAFLSQKPALSAATDKRNQLSDSRANYEIIAGERRFRAAKLAGLDNVPVLVRDVPDEAAAAMALIENMQREDLNQPRACNA
jgi:ParB family chromosome partitioning protein